MKLRWIASLCAFAIAATAGVTYAAGAINNPTDMPSRAAVRVDPPQPVVVIGDSAISALRWVPGADNAVIGFEHTLDLESCRRIFLASCRGREGRTPPSVYQALLEHGRKYKILVVATGYNEGSATMATSFQNVVQRARALGYKQIVWYTLRSDVDYVAPGSVANHVTFAQSNQIIRDQLASGAYPDVVIADWNGYTAHKQDWFVTDGVHYRQIGAWGAADYLSRKIAFLEGRQCPMPTSPGAAPQTPCPDPDVTGPIADIAALYPIGQDGVLCYEIGEDRRVECRFDTHVIQITRVLSQGMTGSDVSALQVRLQRFGLLASADGVFGSVTAQAVRAFQGGNGLPVTGVADKATLAALGFDVSAVPG